MDRVSATGLKDIEADTIETEDITINNELIVGTNNTIIDETGLQIYHPYNIIIPFELEGYWNVHSEIESIYFVLEVIENKG
jgi:hypothetical protein